MYFAQSFVGLQDQFDTHPPDHATARNTSPINITSINTTPINTNPSLLWSMISLLLERFDAVENGLRFLDAKTDAFIADQVKA